MGSQEILDIANKAFDSLSNDQKKEVFLWIIEKIENNPKFQNAKKYWDDLDEEHKSQYYKDGWWSWKYMTTWPLTPKITRKWMKINVKDNLYTTASPLMRLWVSFWLLEKPKDLSNENLVKNIKKDARNLNRYIKLLNITCKAIPELWELVPFVTALKPYAQWYEKNWAPLMQERMKQKESKVSEENVAEELSASEEDILQSNVVERQAA